jgi:hypothetical protein
METRRPSPHRHGRTIESAGPTLLDDRRVRLGVLGRAAFGVEVVQKRELVL